MKDFPIISSIEAQREYVRMLERGIGFTCHGDRAHYLFRPEHIEPFARWVDRAIKWARSVWNGKGGC